MASRCSINGNNSRKTDALKKLWQQFGAANCRATVSEMLANLSATDREFCLWGRVSTENRTLQLSGVGAALLNRLGERCKAPSDEPDVAAAVMGIFLQFGERLLNEESPQVQFGNLKSDGRNVQYRMGVVPALADDRKRVEWLCIMDWSRRECAVADERPLAAMFAAPS